MNLVFATANKNKISEVQSLLPATIELKSLADIGCLEEIPETHFTIEENSREKAEYIFEKYGCNCFSEDSGLEVFALNGEPGVFSAHYSGTRNASENINLLLLNMRGKTDRRAQFKTVFTLVIENSYNQFIGIVTGKIAEMPAGTSGFGYDPIFIPDGAAITFAQMNTAEKNSMSHRTIAFTLLTEFLNKNF